MKRSLVAVFFLLTLAGCGGGGSSSGGGASAGSSSIDNVSTSNRSYTTAAGVQVSERTNTYRVTATTCEALGDQLDGVDGFAAFTSWFIRWSFNGAATTTAAITFTYPFWEPDGTPSTALVSSWSRYIDRLQIHENGHRDIGVSAANRIIASGSNGAARDIIEGARAEEIAYDARTNHGRTQGVVLSCF